MPKSLHLHTYKSNGVVTKDVDVLVIGGGPASLGFLLNAYKSNRHTQLLQGDSLAIIDEGLSFGGGNLGTYGINSNTSAYGFLKCTHRKIKEKNYNASSFKEPQSTNSYLERTYAAFKPYTPEKASYRRLDYKKSSSKKP